VDCISGATAIGRSLIKNGLSCICAGKVTTAYIVQRRPSILSDGAMDEWRALSERDFTRDSGSAYGPMVPRSKDECAAWVMDRQQSSYRLSKFRVTRSPVA